MARIIRVLVVDDSALVRQMLVRALALDPRIEVVGTAKTGVQAVEKARDLKPDVITLDIEMPELSGIEALPHIRKCCDARIVMLSSIDDPDTTYRALARGAVDFISKPDTGVAASLTDLSEELIKVIKTANRISPRQAAAALEAAASDAVAPEAGEEMSPAARGERRGNGVVVCVAIASSTGGPPALERVFKGLSAELPAAYVIVQHLPAGFSRSLARRLASVGEIDVVEATDGMVLEAGKAYVAAHGQHVAVVSRGDRARIAFLDDPPKHGVRPAGDVLLESVAEAFGERSVGVVLTGMGADGAKGALAIRLAGGDTVVQDEETSVVWGMPGSAVRVGAASRVVRVNLVAAEIRRAVRAKVQGSDAA